MRSTSVEVEFDVCVGDILNRIKTPGPLTISGLDVLWLEEEERRKKSKIFIKMPTLEDLLPLNGREKSIMSQGEVVLLTRFYDIVQSLSHSSDILTAISPSEWIEKTSCSVMSTPTSDLSIAEETTNPQVELDELIRLAESAQESDALLQDVLSSNSNIDHVSSTPLNTRSARFMKSFQIEKTPISVIPRSSQDQDDINIEDIDEIVFSSVCEFSNPFNEWNENFNLNQEKTPTRKSITIEGDLFNTDSSTNSNNQSNKDLFSLSQLDGTNDITPKSRQKCSRRLHIRPNSNQVNSVADNLPLSQLTPELPTTSYQLSQPHTPEIYSQNSLEFSSFNLTETPVFRKRTASVAGVFESTPMRQVLRKSQKLKITQENKEVISVDSSSISDSLSHLEGINFFDHSEFLIDSQLCSSESTLEDNSTESQVELKADILSSTQESKLDSSQEFIDRQDSFIQIAPSVSAQPKMSESNLVGSDNVSISSSRESDSQPCFLSVQRDNFTVASLELHCQSRLIIEPTRLKDPDAKWEFGRKKRRNRRIPTSKDRNKFYAENILHTEVPDVIIPAKPHDLDKIDSLHILRSHGLTPTPKIDPILCACLTFQRPYSCWLTSKNKWIQWVLINNKDSSEIHQRDWEKFSLGKKNSRLLQKPLILLCQDEHELINWICYLIQANDPEILIGFDVERQSWGYLKERATQIGRNHFLRDISRLAIELSTLCSFCISCIQSIRDLQKSCHYSQPFSSHVHVYTEDRFKNCICTCSSAKQLSDQPVKPGYGSRVWPQGMEAGRTGASFPCPGRVILCLWRNIKHELSLKCYNLETVAFNLFKEHLPRFPNSVLQYWYSGSERIRTVALISYKSLANLRIIKELDLLTRTSEFSRVFGVEFFHVLSRGTQYRVESVLLRLARKSNVLLVSPTALQRAKQVPPTEIALNLEPENRLYWDGPVAVLDFQSLYPSIAIAYNYCYSTCLGRLNDLANGEDKTFKFGCLDLSIPSGTLSSIKDNVTISPCGTVFLKQNIRESMLKRLWVELLTTRVMIKQSSKLYKDNKSLERLLDSRQLGLKLLANVIYGYTGASFTGRMACSEVADAIVSKARETLTRAIELVRNGHEFVPSEDQPSPEWLSTSPVKVVYGDTDSLFVFMPGRNKEEAFKQAEQMVKAVNRMSPAPVTLKLEKVYYPCILEAKKRYAGYSYESVSQKTGIFDAKGIETVRRDGAEFVGKMLRECFQIVFKSFRWNSKHHLKQFAKLEPKFHELILRWAHDILDCKLNFSDYLITRPYWGIDAYKPSSYSPALEVVRRLVSVDCNAEPAVGERVSFYMAPGSSNDTLVSTVRAMQEAWPFIFWTSEGREIERRYTYPPLNLAYYLERQMIPPLERMAHLCGFDIRSWLKDLPRYTLWINRILAKRYLRPPVLFNDNSLIGLTSSTPVTVKTSRSIMSNFINAGSIQMAKSKCASCRSNEGIGDSSLNLPICLKCRESEGPLIDQHCFIDIMCQFAKLQLELRDAELICSNCIGGVAQSRLSTRTVWNCSNLHCFWHAKRLRNVQSISQLHEIAPIIFDKNCSSMDANLSW